METRSPSRVVHPASSSTTERPDSTLGQRLPRQEIAAITKKKGANRTEADDDRLRELECQRGLWIDGDGAPTIPAAAVRAVIETGARKRRQGGQVREGLIVTQIGVRLRPRGLGTTVEELGRKSQLTVGVVVGRAECCGPGRCSRNGRWRSAWKSISSWSTKRSWPTGSMLLDDGSGSATGDPRNPATTVASSPKQSRPSGSEHRGAAGRGGARRG